LTHAQAALLRAIHHAVTTTGISPTYEELGAAVGLRSRGHVYKSVNALIAQGYVRRGLGQRRRSLEIVRWPTAFGGVCHACGRGPE